MLKHHVKPPSQVDFYPYLINQSLRFNDDDTPRLIRTPDSATNQKTWTFSAWVKQGAINDRHHLISADGTTIRIESDDQIDVYRYSGGYTWRVKSEDVLRDTTQWYNIVVHMDTTQATASNRIKIYKNGVEITAFSSAVYPALDSVWDINSTDQHFISNATTSQAHDGYMSEINFIDGQALDATSFGEFKNGVWIPKEYTGSYGTNGFHLDFADPNNIGNDVSGNNNDWTPVNLVASDVVLDSPTNNYAVLNILTPHYQTFTSSEGNLEFVTSATYWSGKPSTFVINNGKWYAEYTISGTVVRCGVAPSNDRFDDGLNPQDNAGCIQYYTNGDKYISGSATAYGASYTTGDIVGIALDKDADTVTFYKNGISQGSISLTSEHSAGTLFAFYSAGSTVNTNFGQDSTFAGQTTSGGFTDANGLGDFKYPVPAGALALCTANLPEPVIGPNSETIASDHFLPVGYSGQATPILVDVGFPSDLIITKGRNAAVSHHVVDRLRGEGFYQHTNEALADFVGTFIEFEPNGFTANVATETNFAGTEFISWNWKMGGAGVTNNDGTITSTVSANTLAGQSIATFLPTQASGAFSVGHGLTETPDLIIQKELDSTGNWHVWHSSVCDSTDDFLLLNSTGAIGSVANIWGTSVPNTSTFEMTVGVSVDQNNEQVAYCFHSVEGYSKFDSYVGNGSADGPFVYCGFRPAYVMVKRSDATGNSWWITDSSRDTFNVADSILAANSSGAENSAGMDLLSNGFKLRVGGAAGHNDNGGTYIYAAFAENPFKYANAQ